MTRIDSMPSCCRPSFNGTGVSCNAPTLFKERCSNILGASGWHAQLIRPARLDTLRQPCRRPGHLIMPRNLCAEALPRPPRLPPPPRPLPAPSRSSPPPLPPSPGPNRNDGAVQSERGSSQLSTPAIAGIAAGMACALLLLASTIAWCVLRRRKRNARDPAGTADVQPAAAALGDGSGYGIVAAPGKKIGSSGHAVTTPAHQCQLTGAQKARPPVHAPEPGQPPLPPSPA
jgi:hypothetical protein